MKQQIMRLSDLAFQRYTVS